MMKKYFLNLLVCGFSLFLMASCAKNFSQDAEGFGGIEKELQSKFGVNAYYTDIAVTYDKTSGTIILVTETNDPESLKMEEWQYMKGVWQQRAEVTLEISDGAPTDFMYQLNGQFDLKKVGELVEQSAKKLAEEKQINDAVAIIVSVKTPDNDDASATKIYIDMEPENGGTKFSFFYDLDGNLTSFSY